MILRALCQIFCRIVTNALRVQIEWLELTKLPCERFEMLRLAAEIRWRANLIQRKIGSLWLRIKFAQFWRKPIAFYFTRNSRFWRAEEVNNLQEGLRKRRKARKTHTIISVCFGLFFTPLIEVLCPNPLQVLSHILGITP